MANTKFKVWFIKITQIVILIFFIGALIWNYVSCRANGQIKTASDYFIIIIERKLYVSYILVVLGVIGLFLKKKTGWIFTALIFYTITVALIFVSKYLQFDVSDMLTYIPIIGILLYSDWLLNSNKIFQHFGTTISKKTIIKINLVPILTSICFGLILYYSNMK